MRRRGAGERADVVGGGPVRGIAEVCSLGLAHRRSAYLAVDRGPPAGRRQRPDPVDVRWTSSAGRRRGRGAAEVAEVGDRRRRVVSAAALTAAGNRQVGRRRRVADRGQLRELVDLGLEWDRDRLAVADDPDVVEDGAGRVVLEAGLGVAEEALERGRYRRRGVGEKQRARAAAGGGERSGRGGVERPVDVGDREAVPGVVDVPAEVAVGESGELDRVVDRVLGADPGRVRASSGPCRRSPTRGRARTPACRGGGGRRSSSPSRPDRRRRTGSGRRSAPPRPPPASPGSSRSS